MDIFLGKVTQQAMNYAIRSGITITASYAIKQSARLLQAAEATSERDELQDLQESLDSKIKIISPAIDMIELISARGNTSLESAVSLTKQLRWEIQQLGERLQTAANAEELFQKRSSEAQDKARHTLELRQIAQAIRRLLTRIEDAVPLINLAITASGTNLSSSLPTTVSPSRLLQASTFLTAGDSQYANSAAGYQQIGPTFTLSMYMLFAGHIRPQHEEDVRESTWKEVIHKAVVRLMRVPIDSLYDLPGVSRAPAAEQERSNLSTQELDSDYFPSQRTASAQVDEYAYQLVIVEDLDDDRVHNFEANEPQPGSYGEIELAGIREALPIHELSKIFYADTGKILNIGSEGEANSPVLLLKRDPNAIPPRRMMNGYSESNDIERYQGAVAQSSAANRPQSGNSSTATPQRGQPSPRAASSTSLEQSVVAPESWRLPPDLDPEWMAFEVYTEAEDSDTEPEEETTPSTKTSRSSHTSPLPAVTSALSRLNVTTPTSSPLSQQQPTTTPQRVPGPSLPPIRTSLSLLEMLLRLLSLQQFQQTPHLSIPDELLTFFLSESASTGAASNDVQERKRLREEARRRVGFDPYDESPVKRRGEEYQYHGGEEGPERWDGAIGSQYYTDERYGSPISEGREGPQYADEGYGTRSTTLPSRSKGQQPSTPRRAASDTPERWFRSQSSSGNAMSFPTGASPSPVERPPPLTRRSDGHRYGLRDTSSAAAAGRRGSPLARPGTGLTDEGIGTSPSAGVEEKLA